MNIDNGHEMEMGSMQSTVQGENCVNRQTKGGCTGHENKYFSLMSYFPVSIFYSGTGRIRFSVVMTDLLLYRFLL